MKTISGILLVIFFKCGVASAFDWEKLAKNYDFKTLFFERCDPLKLPSGNYWTECSSEPELPANVLNELCSTRLGGGWTFYGYDQRYFPKIGYLCIKRKR